MLFRSPTPWIITGGEGSPRGMRIAVRFSDEFNLTSSTPAVAREKFAKLDEVCGIRSPRDPGLDTVHTVAALHRGDLKVFVGMGGNFVRAAPDTKLTAEGMSRCELTVHVSTKLNRSHLTHGKAALILPCLGRTERDEQESGPQSISTKDAMSSVMQIGRAHV